MPCLLVHKWVTTPRYLNLVSESHPAYRRCKRCGKTQFGLPDDPPIRIRWRTLRKDDSSDAVQEARVLRRPVTWFNRLTHSLGLRQTRAVDDSEP